MSINDFIGEKAEERLQRIKDRQRDGYRQRNDEMKWLFQYIEFLKGNRRAKQDGLD